MHEIILNDARTIAEDKFIEWEKLDNKTVLVVGANGYVPQFFVHGILRHNDLFGANIYVIAQCRDKAKSLCRFSEYIGREDFSILYADICEKTDYERKIDYIIHAASPAGIGVTMSNPLAVFDANVLGVKVLAEVALKNEAKFLYFSSVDVYGNFGSDDRRKETDVGSVDYLSRRNIYATSKRAAESLCMCYEQQNLDYVIIRASQIIGPGIERNDERLHINMVSQMLEKGYIVLKGDGSPKRSFIYITDVISACLGILTKGRKGEIYNICNEENESTVKELAGLVSYLVSGEHDKICFDEIARKTDPSVKGVVANVCVSSEKLRSIGWRGQISLRDACNRLIQYYKTI